MHKIIFWIPDEILLYELKCIDNFQYKHNIA